VKTINVEGLPEPVVAAVARMVDALRNQLGQRPQRAKKAELVTRPGKVHGHLTRSEIYDDAI
jgi:hypothetical protein